MAYPLKKTRFWTFMREDAMKPSMGYALLSAALGLLIAPRPLRKIRAYRSRPNT